MPPLPSDLRRVLENAVIAARDQATSAATAALKRLAVATRDFPTFLSPDERALRLKLRAAARQLGDPYDSDKYLFASIARLTHEVAYEHWHRMLFARFLAENNLLIHPEHNVPVDLATVAELAQEDAAKTGSKPDAWALAGRFAAGMLPQIFRPDDPALAVQLAPEHQQALERILESLPPSVFTAEDALGWVYQFWQSAEKDRVNDTVKAGAKITGETLPAVTQLFTEHYMVLFLLHNTVGAWHAAKRTAAWSNDQMAGVQTEVDARASVALPAYSFDYLRFVKDDTTRSWRPAAGAFSGWPGQAKLLTVLDPCCGSGHFLVAALELLTRLRVAEEGLSAREAATAVIRDNLFGLELDARCTQIAAFNVAVAAWKIVGEHFALPEMRIACSGLAPNCSQEQWIKLADTRFSPQRRSVFPTHPLLPAIGREPVRNTLRDMHELFSRAPELGSLIDPTATASTLGSADWETAKPFLADVMAEDASAGGGADAEAHERAVAAHGMAKVAEILSGEYTLVITNVPYLGRGGQGDLMRAFCEKEYPEAKADLATVFLSRILGWLETGGTTAVVTPQNWLFLTSYKRFRERLLKERTWGGLAKLGEEAWCSFGIRGPRTALLILSEQRPDLDSQFFGIDVSTNRGERLILPAEKAALLRGDRAAQIAPSGNADTPSGAAAEAASPGAGRTDGAADGVFAGTHGANVGTKTASEGPVGASIAAFDTEKDPTAPPMGADAAYAVEVGGDGVTPDGTVRFARQAEQLKNPDARITTSQFNRVEALASCAVGVEGMTVGDLPQYTRLFWEVAANIGIWDWFVGAAETSSWWSGRSQVIRWEEGNGAIHVDPGAFLRGREAWGKAGIRIHKMGVFATTLYAGELFDQNGGSIIPRDTRNTAAVWAFMNDESFGRSVRTFDQALKVTVGTFTKVPFDLALWQKVAAEKYPNGLPEPQSDDPTQWLFHGHPAGKVPDGNGSNGQMGTRLQVAVARLVGYRWPAELDPKMRLAPEARAWVERCKDLESHTDDDGVVPLVTINKERPGHERVRALLEAAFGSRWSPGLLNDLLVAAGSPSKSLEDWLRGGDFWAQHCAVFHHRPFVWQIWDGKKDGFNILVHYHRLAEGDGKGEKLLQKITYTYLGDWITQQQAAAKQGVAGADLRLKAAQDLQKKLELIIAGEPPYDIFVRWKPLHELPIGWNPDINDGVRINIRPFVAADVLMRGKVNVKWTKDRGKEPESIRPKAQFPWFWSCPEGDPPIDFAGGAKFTGERLNDLHYTNKAKQAAREAATETSAEGKPAASGRKG